MIGPDASTMHAARSAAETLMVDACVIRRPTGDVTTDPVTLEPVPVYTDMYRGRCKMQTFEGHETTVDVATGSQVVQRSSVHLPVGAYKTRPGDVVTITTARDPLLVGSSFRIVQEYPVKSFATAYRVFVDANVGAQVPPPGEVT